MKTISLTCRRTAASMRGIGLLAAFAFGAMFALPAHANQSICVKDVTGFSAAMSVAASGVAGDVDVKIAAGTYALGAVSPLSAVVNLRLLGGYNADCSERNGHASTTIFDGENTGMFELYADHGIVIDRIGFRRFHDDQNGAAVRIWTVEGDADDEFTVRNSVFDANRGVDIECVLSKVMTLQNNLFVDNLASGNSSSVTIDPAYHSNAFVSQNTFVDNDGVLFWGSIVDQDKAIRLTGNLFAPPSGQSAFSVDGFMRLAQLDGNLYPFYDGPAPEQTPSPPNRIGVDPLFVDPANGLYQLADGSPAIDAAPVPAAFLLQPQDLDGHSRWVASYPDIGAYENQTDVTQVQVVTVAGDDGVPGDLRSAIVAANANPNRTTIRFELGCPNTIALQSALPDITAPLTIDGYLDNVSATTNTSATGFDANLCVTLSGNGDIDNALRVATTAGVDVDLAVRGLRFTGFTSTPLRLLGGGNHRVQGNQFGTGSLPQLANATNVQAGGGASVLIGGPDAADRNAFGWAYGTATYAGGGVHVSGGNAVTVQNNLIGLKPDGITPAPNRVGVRIISGTASVFDNVIGGNVEDGIRLQGPIPIEGALIARNAIGRTSNGTDIGNGGWGVNIANGNGNAVGDYGFGVGQGNTIGNNVGGGVSVAIGSGNSVRNNAIWGNATLTLLRSGGDPQNIDLGQQGPNPNDPGDADAGPNALQNFPEIVAASAAGAHATVVGRLWTRAGTYVVEVFANNNCVNAAPEAQVRVGVATVSIASAGAPAPFTVNLPGGYDANSSWLTATATNLATNDTSEISRCFDASDADLIFANGFD